MASTLNIHCISIVALLVAGCASINSEPETDDALRARPRIEPKGGIVDLYRDSKSGDSDDERQAQERKGDQYQESERERDLLTSLML